MRRGDLYRVKHPTSLDPKRSRVFVVVSRQLVLDSRFSSVVCAPVYTRHDGLHSQVAVGIDEGLKHDSSVHCDELISLPKTVLTDFIGNLTPSKLLEVDRALASRTDWPVEMPSPARLALGAPASSRPHTPFWLACRQDAGAPSRTL